MSENDIPELPVLGLEPEDLDGHSIEELSDYLDAGRTPRDPSIEESPGCRIALEALERLHQLTPALLAADIAAEETPDENWVQSILSGIALDARAGRRIPIPAEAENADLGITEGALRGVIRAAEYVVPGVVVGRCRFDGDVTVRDEPVRVYAEISVLYGQSIPESAERLRAEISKRLDTHTSMRVEGVDIVVRDIQHSSDDAGRGTGGAA